MLGVITEYIDKKFTEEQQQDILRAISVFDAFELTDVYEPIVEEIMLEDYKDSEIIRDNVVEHLRKALNGVLEAHSVSVDTTSLYKLVELCEAIYRLQHLSDYSTVLSETYSEEPDEIIITNILANLCHLRDVEIMDILENVGPDLIKAIRQLAEDREESQDLSEDDIHFKNEAMLYFHWNKDNSLGLQLVSQGCYIGAEFKLYAKMIEPYLNIENVEQTAKDILSILVISKDGAKDMLSIYRLYSLSLLKDLNTVSKVEAEIIKLITDFKHFKDNYAQSQRLPV